MNNEGILDMLSYRRPAGSKGEDAFIQRFILPHKPLLKSKNLIIEVPGGNEKTLFSCHTDTVHRDDKRQEICYDKEMDVAYKDDGEALGGDNTAGCWLLLEMIKLQIPGVYAFHYGEEKGCIGSRQLARESPDWLKSFDRAIAFDRRDNTSIITFQRGNRTCSDEFALELAKQLGNGFEPDKTGLYTDTASYTHLIRECSNVSIGYMFEHGPDEYLDLGHLTKMLDLVQRVDWDKLPTVNTLTVSSIRDYTYPAQNRGTYGGGGEYVKGKDGVWTLKPFQPAQPKLHVVPGRRRRTINIYDDEDIRQRDEDAIDFLIDAALEECGSFQETCAVVETQKEFAATMLYAFVRRELKGIVDLGEVTDDDEGTPETSVEAACAKDPEVQKLVSEIVKKNFPDSDDYAHNDVVGRGSTH